MDIGINVMGGLAVHREPENLNAICQDLEVYRIFENSGWIVYFEQLQGFNENDALEFSRNLDGEQSMVRGMRIPVTEEIIAEVTHLPRTGEWWFVRKTPLPTAKADFLREGKVVRP